MRNLLGILGSTLTNVVLLGIVGSSVRAGQDACSEAVHAAETGGMKLSCEPAIGIGGS